MTDQQIKHMPALENVTASLMDTQSFLAGWICAFAIILILSIITCFIFFTIHSIIPGMLLSPIPLLSAVVFFTVMLSVLWRYILGCFMWKTNRNGLTIWGLLGCTDIYWHDIQSITIKSDFFRSESYILRTSKGTFRIPAKGNAQIPSLIASIYQHISLNKTLDITGLPKEIETQWVDIPESIPRITEWTNPNPPKAVNAFVGKCLGTIFLVGINIFPVLMVILLILQYFHWFDEKSIKTILCLFSFTTTVCFIARSSVNDTGPISANLTSDELVIVRPSMAYGAKWKDIEASWGSDGTLQLKGFVDFQTLAHDNYESRLLVLNILRTLREKENPIILSIPDDLMEVIKSSAM